MTGITIAIGQGWPELARVTCERMSLMTGCDCRAITSFDPRCIHPSWQKCFVLDYFRDIDEFFVFDADIFPLLPWNPAKLFKDHDGAFLAVPDKNDERVETECQRYGIGFPDIYINGGLTIFSRQHEWIWRKTWLGHPKYGTWLEQTGLNVALKEWEAECGKVVRLDRKYNTLFGHRSIGEAVRGGMVVNAHLAGNGGNAGLLSLVQKDLRWV